MTACQSSTPERHAQLEPRVIQKAPVVTDEWAMRLKPGTDPRLIANRYRAEYIGPIGSLKDTWLIRRPAFNRPDSEDPLRQDSRVLWLQRQVRQMQQKDR